MMVQWIYVKMMSIGETATGMLLAAFGMRNACVIAIGC